MAKKNKRKSNRRSKKGNFFVNLIVSGIFIAIIIAGAAMARLGFTNDHETSYAMVVGGLLLIFLSLMFLSANFLSSDTITIFFAGGFLICLGILHPAVFFMAVLGVYLIVNKILVLTGHKKIADKIDQKISQFLTKLFAHELKPSLDEMNEDARNRHLGIKKVVDMSNSPKQQPKDSVPKANKSTPSIPVITEPDRAASEAMAKPDPGEFITNFVAGFIFTVGGLMNTLPNLLFLAFGSSILDQLPFLLFGGVMLIIGIWQLVKGAKTCAKYLNKN